MQRSWFKGKKAVFLGDSITYGVGASCPENIYHQYLKRSLELGETVNYGISGSRIAHQELNQNGGAFSVRYKDMDDDADIVVVYGGVNDFAHGTAAFGTPEDKKIDTFWGACNLLFEELIKKYPDKIIVVMTPLHWNAEFSPDGTLRTNAVTGKTLAEYVQAIKCSAANVSLPVLDLYACAGIAPQIEQSRAIFCPDGLHPSDEGNRRIAQRLEGLLMTL